MTKGPQCNFSLDLLSMKMTVNVLRTHFYFPKSNESGDKRKLVSFCFTFSEYENEKKVLRTLFHGRDKYEKGIQQNLGSFHDF